MKSHRTCEGVGRAPLSGNERKATEEQSDRGPQKAGWERTVWTWQQRRAQTRHSRLPGDKPVHWPPVLAQPGWRPAPCRVAERCRVACWRAQHCCSVVAVERAGQKPRLASQLTRWLLCPPHTPSVLHVGQAARRQWQCGQCCSAEYRCCRSQWTSSGSAEPRQQSLGPRCSLGGRILRAAGEPKRLLCSCPLLRAVAGPARPSAWIAGVRSMRVLLSIGWPVCHTCTTLMD